MTYCTRCWCIGHMRNKCDLEQPRCLICLNNLIDGQLHDCSNIVRCAQCDGGHHSLSSECEKVIKYRSELKEQVNNAIASGKLPSSSTARSYTANAIPDETKRISTLTIAIVSC